MSHDELEPLIPCLDCGQPSTVHVQTVMEEQKTELHLCRKCAENRKLIVAGEQLQVPAVVKKMTSAVAVVPSELSKQVCPDCGIKYMDFRKVGRLGCPHDYEIFREGLLPLLERVHRSVRHVGKRPTKPALAQIGQLKRLRTELRLAIEKEDFERAAKLRDMIRMKERTDEH